MDTLNTNVFDTAETQATSCTEHVIFVVSISTVLLTLILLSVCSEDEEEMTTSSVFQDRASQPSCTTQTRGHLQRIISIEEDHLPHLLQTDCQTQTPLKECREGEEASDNEDDIDLVMSDIYPCASSAQQQNSKGTVDKRKTPTSPRGQPVGKETSINVSM